MNTAVYGFVGAFIIILSCLGTCVAICCRTSQRSPPEPDIEAPDPLLADKELGDSSIECSICIEEYNMGQPIRVLPCGHYFHEECFDEWNSVAVGVTTCPNCRTDIEG